jgi:hypothetical protein
VSLFFWHFTFIKIWSNPRFTHNFSKIHEYSDVLMNTNNHECLGSDLTAPITVADALPTFSSSTRPFSVPWHNNDLPFSLLDESTSRYKRTTIHLYHCWYYERRLLSSERLRHTSLARVAYSTLSQSQ